MAEYPVEIEVERLMNLARGFGWQEAKREFIEDEIHLTIKKVIKKPEEVPSEVTPT